MTTPKTKLAGLALIAALCAGFTLGLTAPAWAGWDEGLAAYDRGDYATALREWRQLAEQGDTEAQIRLGVIYQDGLGVPRDYAEAARWYHKAAEQGDESAEIYLKQVLRILTEMGLDAVAGKDFASALRLLEPAAELGGTKAQFFLGLMHYTGEGIPQSYREAKKWYIIAANQGYASAQSALGTMYYKGEGVPQIYRRAKMWFLMAAEQGDPDAQSSLGIMYYNGHGVPQGYVQAHMWFNLAAARYHTIFDSKDRDRAASNRDRVAAQMTPAQIAEAQKLAQEWKAKK